MKNILLKKYLVICLIACLILGLAACEAKGNQAEVSEGEATVSASGTELTPTPEPTPESTPKPEYSDTAKIGNYTLTILDAKAFEDQSDSYFSTIIGDTNFESGATAFAGSVLDGESLHITTQYNNMEIVVIEISPAVDTESEEALAGLADLVSAIKLDYAGIPISPSVGWVCDKTLCLIYPGLKDVPVVFAITDESVSLAKAGQ